MIFIGIIANQKEFEALNERLDGLKDIDMVLIDKNNLENLQNVKFDSLIIHQAMPAGCNLQAFERICQNVQYLIVNVDKNRDIKILKNNQRTVINYGLNHKCTVTLSSIRDDYIMVALQREIINKNGNIEEIGEQKVQKTRKLDIYGHLLLAIIDKIYGKFTKY